MSAKRLYTFINFYLSSIQQGIQTQHVDRELTNKYVYGMYGTAETQQFLRDWSMNHKTTIVLNGGIDLSLRELTTFLELEKVEFDGVALPWSTFHEDEASLANLLTGVAIVLPEEIYDAMDYNKAMRVHPNITSFMKKFQRDAYGDDYFWFKDGQEILWPSHGPVGRFLRIMKACGLAR